MLCDFFKGLRGCCNWNRPYVEGNPLQGWIRVQLFTVDLQVYCRIDTAHPCNPMLHKCSQFRGIFVLRPVDAKSPVTPSIAKLPTAETASSMRGGGN